MTSAAGIPRCPHGAPTWACNEQAGSSAAGSECSRHTGEPEPCGHCAMDAMGSDKDERTSAAGPVFCAIHRDTEIVTEPGGPDMPTIHGRRYCPKCQEALMEALDAQS